MWFLALELRNSKGPQQNRADKHKHSAHRQNIELPHEVHSSTSIQIAIKQTSKERDRSKEVPHAARQNHRMSEIVSRIIANVMKIRSNLASMSGCDRD